MGLEKCLNLNQEDPSRPNIQSPNESLVCSKPPVWTGWTLRDLLGSFTNRKGQYAGTQGRVVPSEMMTVRYRATAWIMNRVWELQTRYAYTGWTFVPRLNNMIPYDSLVFQYASRDDVRGLQELFHMRKASPSDCNEWGWTPLHVCLFHPQIMKQSSLTALGSSLLQENQRMQVVDRHRG